MVPNTRSKSQIAIRFLCGFAPLREKRTKIVRSTKYNVPSRGYEVNGAKYPPRRAGNVPSTEKQETRAKRAIRFLCGLSAARQALRLCEQKEKRAEIPAAAGKREAR